MVHFDIDSISSFNEKINVLSNGHGKDARIVLFDSPFVLRLSKDERRLRTGLGNVLRLKKFP
jgi:hypothetical protein